VRRLVILALLGLALLVAGAIAAIFLGSRERLALPPPPPPAAAVAPPRIPASPEAATGVAQPDAAALLPEGSRQKAHVERRQQRSAAPPVDFFRELYALRAGIARCEGISQPSPPRAGSGKDQTVLLLDIEALDGEVRILEASVDRRGTASDDVVACARKQLEGRIVPASHATPGTRFKMKFPLWLPSEMR
jgi:hypothetical protein